MISASRISRITIEKKLHGDKLKQTQHLGEVVVRGNQVKRVNSSAFNVMAVDTRRLRNTNLDLAHVLSTAYRA